MCRYLVLMSTALKKRAALLACIPTLLGLSFGLTPGIAGAETPPQGAAIEETPLTPELATLAEPSVAAASEAAQAEAIALPAAGPGSLVREGGDVVVEAHFEDGAPADTAALEAAGATVLAVSARYQTVALSVAPEDLEAVAAVPGLAAVEPSYEPVFYGVEKAGIGATTNVTNSATPNGLCEGGTVISQAMTQLQVAAARGTFGAVVRGRRSVSSPTPSTRRRPRSAAASLPRVRPKTKQATICRARKAPAAASRSRST
jgi:hypothetical protein